ncbi:DUF4258 domain-containing protein [Halovibrio salipaludis]|uniref:DUF4258 domain-containing protein n=2 Tax=Halovibrio salipaludis TaxID=2032626 RepID=A0A2A2FD00_9GAMM|nr:DUF4258 domain-containing protein [Halovibrio salipaludis]
MFIERFGMQAVLTRHAQQRMTERHISIEEICHLLETGTIRLKDDHRFWAATTFQGRSDNLICVAAVFEPPTVVIKTVMHHFSWEA